MKYEELYLAYLIYFNRDRDYFECHEVLEELWLARGSDPLYKGLLQVAVGLFHFRDGNVAGSLKMMRSAAAKLAGYPPDSLGIKLGKLRDELEVYVKRLSDYQEQPFDYYDLTIEISDPELAKAVEQASPLVKANVPLQLKRQRGPKHELRGKDRT
ncbi:DUF309 domain-containing protein [Paenibacillus physcomitrellae]|uniref:DUF309 domain-containing protein n=2 Tax=Paenibacillus physcomitrellae TaxID=1619311 RepID=A0ABQ1GIQ5_9BACL|nr:DUF309 domain-containing protein [Paenibacillus physcomitrellae]GGA44463.1 hypothetical protein GCM10010917_32200 [Paenibacillus physcomitrellae]